MVRAAGFEPAISRLKIWRLDCLPTPSRKLPGAPDWNRTNCPPVKSRMLILMSFEREQILVGPERIELPRCSLKRRVLYRLSYGPQSGWEAWTRTTKTSFRDWRPAFGQPPNKTWSTRPVRTGVGGLEGRGPILTNGPWCFRTFVGRLSIGCSAIELRSRHKTWCGVLESNQGHPLCRSGTLPV